MTTTTGEATTEQAAVPQIVGKIETDVFCSGCHYNLHSLDVIRDERLDMAVVRCPECGKFHPAGMATGAGRVWLSRLAGFLILLWIGFLGLFVLGLGFAYFITDVISVEAFLSYAEFDGGRGWQRVPAAWVRTTPEWQRELFYMNAALFGANALLGWTLGAGGAIFAWHLKRVWLVMLCLMPLLAFGIASLIFSTEVGRYGPGTSTWVTGRLITQALLHCGGIIAGIVLGRAVARGVLRAVLTRRLVQHVRFLWTADGKVPPGMHG